MSSRQINGKEWSKRCQFLSSLCHSASLMLILNQISSYHFVSGVEASSSASLAAYLNSLTYAVEDASGWLSKGPVWKVRSGVYWCGPNDVLRSALSYFHFPSCYNAFSRVDVRVDVKIPGGVNAYVVDLRGERCVMFNLLFPISSLPSLSLPPSCRCASGVSFFSNLILP